MSTLQITLDELRTHFDAVIAQLEANGGEIVVTEDGKPKWSLQGIRPASVSEDQQGEAYLNP